MRNQRGAVRSRLLALGLYLVTAVFGALLLPLLVLGPRQLVQLAPEEFRSEAANLITAAYWPAVILLVLLGLVTFYHLAPPRRLPWRRGLPGAIVAMGVFILGGVLLRRYITLVATRAFSYGVMAAPIAALLFLFLLAFAVLFGAELNALIEQSWPAHERVRHRRLDRLWRRRSLFRHRHRAPVRPAPEVLARERPVLGEQGVP
jgi:membrane protein